MSSTKAKRHIHKYYRMRMGSNYVWACALPDCNHYLPKHMEESALGKYTTCWTCGTQTTLRADNMGMREPICKGCMRDIDPTYNPESGMIEPGITVAKIVKTLENEPDSYTKEMNKRIEGKIEQEPNKRYCLKCNEDISHLPSSSKMCYPCAFL